MKTKLILLIMLFVTFSSLAKSDEIKADTNAMANLIKDIIDFPAHMLITMSNNEQIDCSKIVNLFKQDEILLIDFTMKIARLRCNNFKYDGIDINTYNKHDKIFELYYIKDDGSTSDDWIRFAFVKKDNKIIFKGITGTID